jgi:hypothetical protein
MGHSALHDGKATEPCKECHKPLGEKGIWFPFPFNGAPAYGYCPPCHQAQWEQMIPGCTSAPLDGSTLSNSKDGTQE